ncbi:BspA family leucine-rich repeat surface protein [Mycoplasma mycoides]|uniref:BspA family leucine-rich repeat surface protein n=1 Tax=Mycoplasma mycoides TaxID=2102 RepID=UPI002AD44A60|nr:BspA family leucine-rich repeat surface protein [Mycoplasma mycoides]
MGKIIKKAVYNKDKTECLKIGYFKNDKGEIQIIQMPPTITKVPKTLPKKITNLSKAFGNNINITISGIEYWDVSNIKDMSYMFYGAEKFNQPIGKWNTSNVEDMSYMFNGATSFDKEKHWNKSLSKSRTR